MLIGVNQPSPITFSLNNATWLSTDNGSALVDGRPSRRSRIAWPGGAPSLTQSFDLRALWTAPTAIRIVALLGLGIPAGVRIEVRGRRQADAGWTYALGGAALTQRTVGLPGGAVCHWLVLPAGLDPLVGLEWRFFNDDDGAIWAGGGGPVDIGEIVAMPAADLPHDRNWAMRLVDPSRLARSLGGQVSGVIRTPWRELRCALSPVELALVRGPGLDWQSIGASAAGGRRVALVPRTVTPLELHRTAVYGVAEIAETGHLGGDYYSSSITVSEVPA